MEDGGSAFPSERVVVQQPHSIGQYNETIQYSGMSLRDYFAGQVLMGMHARDTYDEGQATSEMRAHLSYLEADAMLEERNKTAGGD